MTLFQLGWDDVCATHFQPHSAAGLTPARVALEHKHRYELLTPDGELTADCTGRLLHDAQQRADLPAVGDWGAVRVRPGETHADIHAVLPRRSVFSRQAVGGAAAEQIVAANVDTVLLVTALDQNYNLRRIERYLAAAWASGAQPVVVLNKADLHPDAEAARAEVSALARGAPVVVLSALDAGARTVLAPWLVPGRTLALLGSSGVGKSTLVNLIAGDAQQATSPVSAAVGKGRHTTTHRELVSTASGVLLLDTPGMRELQLWDTDEAVLDHTFGEVAALAARCRFRDCAHGSEPGCAVREALETGDLDAGRWQSFQKLQREQAYAARRSDAQAARASKAAWKKIGLAQRARRRFEDADG